MPAPATATVPATAIALVTAPATVTAPAAAIALATVPATVTATATDLAAVKKIALARWQTGGGSERS